MKYVAVARGIRRRSGGEKTSRFAHHLAVLKPGRAAIEDEIDGALNVAVLVELLVAVAKDVERALKP